jgi:hypothetical protein
MSHTRNDEIAGAPYTPDSDDRRATRRDESRTKRVWWAPFTLKDLAILVAAAIAAFSAMGFRVTSPDRQIAAEALERAAADTAIHAELNRSAARAENLEHRINDLSDRMTFITYLQCEQARTSGASLTQQARTDCQEIIQKRLAP